MGDNIYIKNNSHLFLLPGIIFSYIYIYYFLFKSQADHTISILHDPVIYIN